MCVHTCGYECRHAVLGHVFYDRMGAKKVKNTELDLEVRLDSEDNIQVDLGYGSF